jgi:hypothetical protein
VALIIRIKDKHNYINHLMDTNNISLDEARKIYEGMSIKKRKREINKLIRNKNEHF